MVKQEPLSLDEAFRKISEDFKKESQHPVTPPEDCFQVTHVIKNGSEIDPEHRELWKKVNLESKGVTYSEGKQNYALYYGQVEESDKILVAFKTPEENLTALYNSKEHGDNILVDLYALIKKVPEDKRTQFIKDSIRLLQISNLEPLNVRYEILHNFVTTLTENTGIPIPLTQDQKLVKPSSSLVSDYDIQKINFLLARIHPDENNRIINEKEYSQLLYDSSFDFQHKDPDMCIRSIYTKIRSAISEHQIDTLGLNCTDRRSLNLPQMKFERDVPQTTEGVNEELAKIPYENLTDQIGKGYSLSGYKAAFIDSSQIAGTSGENAFTGGKYAVQEKSDRPHTNDSYFRKLAREIRSAYFVVHEDITFIEHDDKYYLNDINGKHRTMAVLLRGASNIPVLYREVETA